MTALTIFTPSRSSTSQYSEGSVHIGSEDDIQPDIAQGSAAIYVRGDDLKTTPHSLRDMPMEVIRVIILSSPVTRVADGSHPHPGRNMTADVGTYIERDGTSRQSIVLTGRDGATLEEMIQWFDTLK